MFSFFKYFVADLFCVLTEKRRSRRHVRKNRTRRQNHCRRYKLNRVRQAQLDGFISDTPIM